MDVIRELVVREAMFNYLDGLLASSSDNTVHRDNTAEISFLGERIVMRQLYGRGIHKPQTLSTSLSTVRNKVLGARLQGLVRLGLLR